MSNHKLRFSYLCYKRGSGSTYPNECGIKNKGKIKSLTNNSCRDKNKNASDYTGNYIFNFSSLG